MIGRNRKARDHEHNVVVTRAGENSRQHRPASRYGSGWGTVKLAACPSVSRFADSSADRVKPSYAGPARPALSGDTPNETCFFS